MTAFYFKLKAWLEDMVSADWKHIQISNLYLAFRNYTNLFLVSFLSLFLLIYLQSPLFLSPHCSPLSLSFASSLLTYISGAVAATLLYNACLQLQEAGYMRQESGGDFWQVLPRQSVPDTPTVPAPPEPTTSPSSTSRSSVQSSPKPNIPKTPSSKSSSSTSTWTPSHKLSVFHKSSRQLRMEQGMDFENDSPLAKRKRETAPVAHSTTSSSTSMHLSTVPPAAAAAVPNMLHILQPMPMGLISFSLSYF